jgi:hypothetical protein
LRLRRQPYGVFTAGLPAQAQGQKAVNEAAELFFLLKTL